MREVQGGDIQDTREERRTQARIWENDRRRKRRKEGKFLLQSQLGNLPILLLASLSTQSTVPVLTVFLQNRSLLSLWSLTSVQQLHPSILPPPHLFSQPPLSQIPLLQSARPFRHTSSPSLLLLSISSLASPPPRWPPLPSPSIPPPPTLLTPSSGLQGNNLRHHHPRKSLPMQSQCRRLKKI